MSEKKKPLPPASKPMEVRGTVTQDSGLAVNNRLPGKSETVRRSDTFVMQSQPMRPIGGGGNGSGGNGGGNDGKR